METITISTRNRTDFVNVTQEVSEAVKRLGVTDGVVTVFVPHTTCGVTINEAADPDVVDDMATALEKTVPWRAGYAHAEGNAAAHIKASLVGSSVSIIREREKLALGTWQGVFLCEFDGPRTRRIWIKASHG
ncbi:MAG: secondary thiamine-phosphate synthase enzyme YjbQ [Planctomycetota bacterium]